MISKRREINVEVHLFILTVLTGYTDNDTMILWYYNILGRPIFWGGVFVGWVCILENIILI